MIDVYRPVCNNMRLYSTRRLEKMNQEIEKASGHSGYERTDLFDQVLSFKKLCDKFLEECNKEVIGCQCNKCMTCRWRELRKN